MNNFNFVTGTTKVYHLAGNDWFAVSQNDETVLLVDTDAALPRANGILVGLECKWSDGALKSIDGENGQTLLDYANGLTDKYFGKIKYAMKQINIACDYEEYMCFSEPKNLGGNVANAYMFPLSYDELNTCRAIGGKIYQNSKGNRDNLKNEIGDNISSSIVWTRTFSGIGSGNYRFARCLYNASGSLSSSSNGVSDVFRVAPAFNLKKSLIDHITEDGEIILKLEDAGCNNGIAESYSNVIDYVQSIVNVHDAEIKLHGCSDISEEKVQLCRDILQLANTTVTEK